MGGLKEQFALGHMPRQSLARFNIAGADGQAECCANRFVNRKGYALGGLVCRVEIIALLFFYGSSCNSGINNMKGLAGTLLARPMRQSHFARCLPADARRC